MAVEDWSSERQKELNIKGFIIAGILIAAAVFFTVNVVRSSLLTGQLFLIFAAVLAGVCLLLFLSQIPDRWALNIVGMVFCILITIVLAIGSYFLLKYNQTITKVAETKTMTYEMAVVVLDEDEAQTIQDVADAKFGYQLAVDAENTNKMIDEVKNLIGDFERKEYADTTALADGLLNGSVRAIILNRGLLDVIEEEREGFTEKVRILHSYKIEMAHVVEKEEKDEGVFNILISGIDVAGDITTNSRSDVNILMTVNMNTHDILLTNTPRDYYVVIPEISGNMKDKLTHAGIFGVEASMRTLEALYDIDIDHYIRVNFTSLEQVVNALGGVTVNSDFTFTAGGYRFVKGLNQLDGASALAFCRERHAFSDGDNQRGKNQQAVLTAILQKLTDPATLMNADDLMDSLMGFVDTDLSRKDIGQLVSRQLIDRSSYNVERQVVTGTGASKTTYTGSNTTHYVMIPNEESVKDASWKIKSIMNGK